jgi:RNA-directed DNA polymerase
VRDRVVQAALKLVLEPIWETDFRPCSYGFRPGRRAQDAIAEIHHLASHSYEWVLDGDITACFDELSHSALLERVRERIADKRVLALVKAFLTAGILTEDGAVRDTVTGTPQGGILSPLLRTAVGAGTATPPGTAQLPDRAVCGRLRGARGRHPRRYRGGA